ncbi:hypothetical protein [Desulfobacterium sp. N47]|uniref:hypothetical protein n=1 Tax=Desulfobacterium sp. N47 TaxID=3115210 RepID=UPI003F4A5E61
MNKIINRRLIILLLPVLVVGVAFMWWMAHSTNRDMRDQLLIQARVAARAINIKHITSLSGLEDDLNTHAYQSIKSQLALMRNAGYKCRFLYLMGQRSDGVVFFPCGFPAQRFQRLCAARIGL